MLNKICTQSSLHVFKNLKQEVKTFQNFRNSSKTGFAGKIRKNIKKADLSLTISL